MDGLFEDLNGTLSQSVFSDSYPNESAFEDEVWRIVRARCAEHFRNEDRLGDIVLTSHTKRIGRSAEAWRRFLSAEHGPDVDVLGSNNRVDIVVLHPRGGSIGIEVKCLSAKSHARKLTQGLGQSVLSLAARDKAILVIHCGAVPEQQRHALRELSKRICRDTRLRLLVVPKGPGS